MHVLNLKVSVATVALLVASQAVCSAPPQPEVVFDNSANLVNQTPNFFSGREYGDELYLAGSARQVTEFQFAYFGNFGTTPGVAYDLRFYANDGTDAYPGAPTALRPKSLLWESGPQSILNGINKATVSVPGVLVPDHFTWSITFVGLDGTPGKQAALMLANPATVGAILPGSGNFPPVVGSYDDFWKKDDPTEDQSWMLYSFGFAPTDPKGNFYARVVAVPDNPGLQISHVESYVIVSWLTGATGYVLEGTNDLAPSGMWSRITDAPLSINGVNYVTQSPAKSLQFYRLRRQ